MEISYLATRSPGTHCIAMAPFFVDLHTHLRGTLSPSAVIALAERNGVSLPSGLLTADGQGFAFRGFQNFLEVYDTVGRVVRHASDLTEATEEYLMLCAAEGTRYVELMHSPDHSEDNGIPLKEQLQAIHRGICRANAATGIRSYVVVTAVRHRGPDAAIRLAEIVASLDHPVVRGFGLTGDERRFDVKEFSGAFYLARSVGLGTTAHVGEWGDAKSVLRAVDELVLDRVGHGLSVAEDSKILAELADRNVGFEVCISSNTALDRVPVLAAHPVRAMFDAGCSITLATDDPAYFRTSTRREYQIAANELGFSDAELRTITTNGIACSFAPAQVKEELLQELEGNDDTGR